MSNYRVIYKTCPDDHLEHFGILGQKWGVRRFQNEDGTLTEAGKSRYQRGKEYAEEFYKIAGDRYDHLKSKSKELKTHQDKLDQIQKRQQERERIGGWRAALNEDHEKEFTEEYEKVTKLLEDFWNQSEKHAAERMTEKYGKTPVPDIEYYQQKNVKRVGVLAAALLASPFILKMGIKKIMK